MTIQIRKNGLNRSFDLSVKKIIYQFHSLEDENEQHRFILWKLKEWMLVNDAEWGIGLCSKVKRKLLRRRYLEFILLGLLRMVETQLKPLEDVE